MPRMPLTSMFPCILAIPHDLSHWLKLVQKIAIGSMIHCYRRYRPLIVSSSTRSQRGLSFVKKSPLNVGNRSITTQYRTVLSISSAITTQYRTDGHLQFYMIYKPLFFTLILPCKILYIIYIKLKSRPSAFDISRFSRQLPHALKRFSAK